MKRFRLATAIGVLAVLGTVVLAWGYYTTAGEGTGSGTVGSMTAPVISVPAASTGSHAVTWTTQASVSSGDNADIDYFVERKLGTGEFQEITSGGCDGPLDHGTTSCTDAVGASGNYTYRVIAKFRTWTATSNEAGAVVVTLGGTAPAQPTSVALANGGGVGNAYINDANKGSVNVTVGLGTTSLATDTVHVTITDGTHTTTDKTAPATTGPGSVTVTGIDASGLDDGSVTLRATSSNVTGTSPERTATVTKDTTTPVSSASGPQYANSSPITVDYTATDTSGSGVKEVELWARKAGGTFAKIDTDTTPASPSFAFTPTEGEGTYEFYTRATDNAANYEGAPGTPPDDSTFYDTTKPVSSASSPDVATSSPITVSYTATDTGGSGVKEVELWARKGTSGAFTKVATDTDPATASFDFVPFDGDGTYQFYTRAKDNAANYEDEPGTPPDDSTVYDATGPTVTSIARTGTAGNPTDAASVQWLVTYSESVTGVDAADFALATTGVTGASITGVTGSGSTWTVTASTGSGSGTIGLAALDNDTITDGVGNNLQAGVAEDAAWRYTIDKPSVVSINRASSENPTNDPTVSWTVTFSEPVSGVNVGANSDFSLVQTGTVANSSLTSVSPVGGSAPATSWTVQANTGDLNTTGTLGLNLTDNDSITDAGGRRLGGEGTGNGDFTGAEFTIDKVAPQLQTLEMIETGTPDGRIDQVKATFNEALNESSASSTTGWTLSNVPGGVAFGSVTIDGMTAKLNLSGGTAGSQSTTTVQGNQNFTVALSSSTGQIRDALDNKSGFSAQIPTDKAGPVPFDYTDDDTASSGGPAANNGLFQLSDVLTVSFTEPLATYDTTTGGPDAIVRNGTPATTGNDDVSLPGTLDSAFRTLSRTDYLTSSTAGIQATFPGASAARAPGNNDRHKIEIKLGTTACTPAANCSALTKAGAAADYTYVPDSAITDQSSAANAAVGSFTKSSLLF